MPTTAMSAGWEALPARWWTDRDAALDAVAEVAKLLHYWAGGAFRSTTAPPM